MLAEAPCSRFCSEPAPAASWRAEALHPQLASHSWNAACRHSTLATIVESSGRYSRPPAPQRAGRTAGRAGGRELPLERCTSCRCALALPRGAWRNAHPPPRCTNIHAGLAKQRSGRTPGALLGAPPAAKAHWRPTWQLRRYSRPPAPQKLSQASGRAGGRDRSRAAHLRPRCAGSGASSPWKSALAAKVRRIRRRQHLCPAHWPLSATVQGSAPP